MGRLFRLIPIAFLFIVNAYENSYAQDENSAMSTSDVIVIPQIQAQAQSLLDNIPVPPGAREIDKFKGIDSKIDDQQIFMKTYDCELSVEQVRNFYKKTLSSLGWNETDFTQFLGNSMPLMAGDNSSQGYQLVKNNLTFLKNYKMLTVVFLPVTKSIQQVTRFSVSVKDMPVDTSSLPMEFLSGKKEALDFMPEHSEVRQVGLTKKANGINVRYGSKIALEILASFYKNNMPQYGWRLENEQKMAPKTVSSMSAECESCPKINPAYQHLMSSTTMENRILSFANDKGDTCVIHISEMKGVSIPLGNTTLSVDYTKK